MTDIADEVNVAADGSLRPPASFESIADERKARKEKLAGALRIFGRLGFAEGVAGHITARDPELLDHFWVNPFGKSFRYMKVSDLILVNHQGEVVQGDGPLNRAAFAIHSQLHDARPDVVAAAHCHAMYGKTFSTLGRQLDPISQDACMFYNDVALCADDGGAIVLNTGSGRKMADALGDKKVLIHQNHGVVTVGHSVDEAAWWFIAMERACQSQLMAEAVGTPLFVPHESAQFSYEQSGHPAAGWFQFQPLWEELITEETDFLD